VTESDRQVRDRGADPKVPTTLSYQHSAALGYHADPADIVALLCVRPAKSGGLSSIVRSAAVHDELARTRPDLVQVLYQPWWRDLRTGDGPDSFRQSPVYARDDHGRLSVSYGPDYIRSAQRGAHVPSLSSAQVEAMALLDQLNSDPRFSVTMDLQPGDIRRPAGRRGLPGLVRPDPDRADPGAGLLPALGRRRAGVWRVLFHAGW
jgi:hypothetical protein